MFHQSFNLPYGKELVLYYQIGDSLLRYIFKKNIYIKDKIRYKLTKRTKTV